eukprot:jgi/Mesvir1/10494/Mv15047-RA.1
MPSPPSWLKKLQMDLKGLPILSSKSKQKEQDEVAEAQGRKRVFASASVVTPNQGQAEFTSRLTPTSPVGNATANGVSGDQAPAPVPHRHMAISYSTGAGGVGGPQVGKEGIGVPTLSAAALIHAMQTDAAAVHARPDITTLPGENEISKIDMPFPEASGRWRSITEFRNYREIGSGRTSLVYVGECAATGTPVALKVYYRSKMTKMNERQVSREIRAMRLMAGHPCVCQLLGMFFDEKCIYMVLEYCPRGDLLRQLDASGGRLKEKHMVQVVLIPLLKALDYLHTHGFAHRDIKPENIFIAADGNVKLGDFGLCIDMSKERPVSRIGTLDYMAPELLMMPVGRSETPVPSRSYYNEMVDCWAVGILTYELLVGRPPFEVESEEVTCAMILWTEMPVGDTWPLHLSLDAISFIKKSLDKNRDSRMSVRQMLQHPLVRKYMSAADMQLFDQLHGSRGSSVNSLTGEDSSGLNMRAVSRAAVAAKAGGGQSVSSGSPMGGRLFGSISEFGAVPLPSQHAQADGLSPPAQPQPPKRTLGGSHSVSMGSAGSPQVRGGGPPSRGSGSSTLSMLASASTTAQQQQPAREPSSVAPISIKTGSGLSSMSPMTGRAISPHMTASPPSPLSPNAPRPSSRGSLSPSSSLSRISRNGDTIMVDAEGAVSPRPSSPSGRGTSFLPQLPQSPRSRLADTSQKF